MRVLILALTMSAAAALPAAAGRPCAAFATFGDSDKASCILGGSAALESLLAMPGGDDAATSARFDGGRSHGPAPASRAEFRPAFFPGGFSLPPPLPPPPTPLPPNSLTPSLGDAARISAPTPQTETPIAAAPVRAAPPVALPAPLGGDSSSSSGGDPGQTPCGDLRDKARRLRSAADQCDSDVGNGAPYCNVKVTFSRPSLPRTLDPGSARGYADEFDRIADRADERACSSVGGEGPLPSGGRSSPSVAQADRYYANLCAGGDVYGCDARQIATLCFDSSPVNDCVRDCLVEQDQECAAIPDAGDRLECRRRAHFQCYERSCKKILPTYPEYKCFSRFPRWKQFLCMPNMPEFMRGWCQ